MCKETVMATFEVQLFPNTFAFVKTYAKRRRAERVVKGGWGGCAFTVHKLQSFHDLMTSGSVCVWHSMTQFRRKNVALPSDLQFNVKHRNVQSQASSVHSNQYVQRYSTRILNTWLAANAVSRWEALSVDTCGRRVCAVTTCPLVILVVSCSATILRRSLTHMHQRTNVMYPLCTTVNTLILSKAQSQ
jgi:hypothetical protein